MPHRNPQYSPVALPPKASSKLSPVFHLINITAVLNHPPIMRNSANHQSSILPFFKVTKSKLISSYKTMWINSRRHADFSSLSPWLTAAFASHRFRDSSCQCNAEDEAVVWRMRPSIFDSMFQFGNFKFRLLTPPTESPFFHRQRILWNLTKDLKFKFF